MNKYYSVENVNEIEFYQLPKKLIKDNFFKNISLGAKLVYSVLRDRQTLSIKNNWINENGNVFFYYDNDKISEELNISRTTFSKYKKELIKYNLLEQTRQGQGKPNKMYLLRVDNALMLNNCTSRSKETVHQDVKKLHSSNNELSKNEVSKNELKKEIYTSSESDGFASLGNYEDLQELNSHFNYIISKYFNSYNDDIHNISSCIFTFYYRMQKYKKINHSKLTDKQFVDIINNIIDTEFIYNSNDNKISSIIDYFNENQKYYSMQQFFSRKSLEIYMQRYT